MWPVIKPHINGITVHTLEFGRIFLHLVSVGLTYYQIFFFFAVQYSIVGILHSSFTYGPISEQRSFTPFGYFK